MRQFLTVTLFALITIGFFAGYSNYGIPQIEPAPPPVDEEIDLSAMDMPKFIALGEKLFNGKGTCTLCHNSLGRAPMLDQVGVTAPERLADDRYAGTATDIESYLEESLVDPSAYVVEGFGKAGTNDSESPMPSTESGGISLSAPELAAVIAYLQDSGGAEVTVEIPTDMGAADDEADSAVEPGEPRPAFTDPMELVSEFSCDACHIINGEGGDLGPDLSAIGAQRDKDHIRRSLLDPNAELAEGFEADLMPADMGEQLYASELEILVDFLAAAK